MIVFGGHGESASGAPQVLADGAAYNPTRNVWQKVAPPLLKPTSGPTVAWTGREMVLWGGARGPSTASWSIAEGEAYNPRTDTWRVIAAAPISPRESASAVWTGREILVYGGGTYHEEPLADGAAYDPGADTWRKLPPGPRLGYEHGAVWTGSEMLLAAGWATTQVVAGAMFSPARDEWSVLPESPTLAGGQYFAIAWTGSEMLIWGGAVEAYAFGDGAAYRPAR